MGSPRGNYKSRLMKILADMPISPKTVQFLKDMGIESCYVIDFNMERASDKEIIRFAKKNGYTILTEDLDFGTILAHTKEIEPGIIILRVGNISTEQINKLLKNALPAIIKEKNCIIIIEKNKIRIRRLPIRLNK